MLKLCLCSIHVACSLFLQPKPSMVVSRVYPTLENTDLISPGMVSQWHCGIQFAYLKKIIFIFSYINMCSYTNQFSGQYKYN